MTHESGGRSLFSILSVFVSYKDGGKCSAMNLANSGYGINVHAKIRERTAGTV